MPLKREHYTRPHGRRFPNDVQVILTEYLNMLSKTDKDKNDDIIRYRSEINPKSSYNIQRKNAALHIARKLSVEVLPEFLTVSELSMKSFLELIIETNSGKEPFGEDWKELSWPDKDGAILAEFLDSADEKDTEIIYSLIGSLLPAYFADFLKKLQEPSGEFGKEDKQIPIYAAENKDYIPETKGENLSDRLVCTLEYLTAQLADNDRQLMNRFNLEYKERRTSHPRHYWSAFNIRQIDRVCESLQLSPHWVFYGFTEPDRVVLAKRAETEKIMDMYYFLPKCKKMVINGFAKKIYEGK